MEFDQQLLNKLRIVFETELKEHAEIITEGLLALEKTQFIPDSQDRLEEIFRAAHSIKGSARGIGLNDVVDIAHRIESIFSLLKKGEIILTATIVDKILLAVDLMQEQAATEKKGTSASVNCAEILVELNGFLQNKIPAPLRADVRLADRDSGSGGEVKRNEERDAFFPERLGIASSDIYSISDRYVNQLSVVAEDVLSIKNERELQSSAIHRLIDQLDACSNDLAHMINRFSSFLTEEVIKELMSHARDVAAVTEQGRHVFNNMRQTNRRLNQVSLALKASTYSLQLVALSGLLTPLHRIVRELTNQLGKKVDFIIQGGDIEIDRKLYKFIHDPIVQLINNAIDHGIELPEIRKRLGKPEEAQLCLEIRKQGDRLSITVKDDGAGLNLEKIKQKALQKKLLTQPELNALSHDEIVDIIFKPEFSSKDIITDISGRGMGLAVVHSNLRQLRGHIGVKTEQGEGCSFNLLVPVSLTSERGILVKSASKTFVFANFAVDRVLTISKNEILELAGKSVIFIKQAPIPLYDLTQLLELTHLTEAKRMSYSIVVLMEESRKIAVVVDEILGEKELIIRPFGYPLIKVRNATGIAMLGNGRLGIMLNAINIIDSALNMQPVQTSIGDDNKDVEIPRILVVDDTVTTRTLEKSILENQGYRVHTVNDGAQAWEEIQKNQYDLIVTDIEMPVMNGFELVERIKNNPETKAIPVVIVTSLNSKEDKHRGIQAGADAFVTKDLFKTELFLKIIEQLL